MELSIITRHGNTSVVPSPIADATDFYVGQKITFPDIGGAKPLTGVITEIEYRSFNKILITLEGESGGVITLDLKIEFPLVEALDDI